MFQKLLDSTPLENFQLEKLLNRDKNMMKNNKIIIKFFDSETVFLNHFFFYSFLNDCFLMRDSNILIWKTAYFLDPEIF